MPDRPDTSSISAALGDAIKSALNEWRMEDSGELWCPVEEQPRLVVAVVAQLLGALESEKAENKRLRHALRCISAPGTGKYTQAEFAAMVLDHGLDPFELLND